jgi:hypothetical protein
MRLMGIQAKNKQKKKRTTDSRHGFPRYPNLVLDMEIVQPDQAWVCDGRPFGRLVNLSLDMTHHQGWVS